MCVVASCSDLGGRDPSAADTTTSAAETLLAPLTWGDYLVAGTALSARKDLAALVGQSGVQALEAWWAQGNRRPRKLVIPTPLSKDKRREAHHVFRQHFANLETGTADDPEGGDGKCVTVSVQRKRGKGGRQQRMEWPKAWPEYLQFVLHKANCGTASAVGLLAQALYARAGTIGCVNMVVWWAMLTAR